MTPLPSSLAFLSSTSYLSPSNPSTAGRDTDPLRSRESPKRKVEVSRADPSALTGVRGRTGALRPATMKEEWVETAGEELGEGPMFFQPFVDGSDERMMIPHDFLKNIINEKLVSADILSPLGQWHVKVECIESSYYFTEGWPDFVLHHALQIGYFLVFCHHGSMSFSVLVLDGSFCQKIYDPRADDDNDLQEVNSNANSYEPAMEIDIDLNESHTTIEDQKTDKYPKFKESSVSFRTTIRPCNLAGKYFLYIPVYFKEALGIPDEGDDLILRDENKELWLVEARRSTKNRTMLGRGWKDFCWSHNLRSGDVCLLRPTTDCIQEIKVVQVQIFQQPEEYRHRVIQAQKTCGTDLSTSRFWITLSSYSFNDYLIQIPNAYSAAMRMSDMRAVTLIDKSGESFYVELMHTTRNRIFFVTTGWREFCLAQDLKPGDVCTFEADGNFKENCLLHFVTSDKSAKPCCA